MTNEKKTLENKNTRKEKQTKERKPTIKIKQECKDELN